MSADLTIATLQRTERHGARLNRTACNRDSIVIIIAEGRP